MAEHEKTPIGSFDPDADLDTTSTVVREGGWPTRLVFNEHALVKIVREPDSVGLKMCPAMPDGEWAEGQRTVDGMVFNPVSASLDRRRVNRLIKDLRAYRDAVWGMDE